MNFSISRGLKTAKAVVTANSPVLLVGAAIAGVVTTGVLSAKAGYKARGIVDAEQAKRDTEAQVKGLPVPDPLTFQEKAQLTWLCYAVPAVTGVSTIASCLGVHVIHTKRHAALAGLYAITANKLDDYKEEAEKLLGTKKTQQLNDAISQKSADENPIDPGAVIVVEEGSELCYDEWSGRWFYSNMNKIAAGLNEANRVLIDEGDLELNTLYERIGLTSIQMGYDFGWSGEAVHISYGTITSPDGRPAIAISFRKDPKPNLGRKK